MGSRLGRYAPVPLSRVINSPHLVENSPYVARYRRVLKERSSEIAPILALIYNETLAQGTVPDNWRQANVAPIFKEGEKYDAANYRPVSHASVAKPWSI